MNALGYLLAVSLVGRVRRAVRLLRTPRYAVGFAFGVAYIGVFMVGPLVSLWTADRAAPFRGAEVVRTTRHVAGALLGVLLVLQCVAAEEGLAFRDSELAFLSAAPLGRGWLLAYRLLDGQVAMLVAALVFGSAAWKAPGGSVWSIPGMVVALELLALTRTYWALAYGSLCDRGRSTTWAKLVPLSVVVGLLVSAGLSAMALERAGRPAWRAGRTVDPSVVFERVADIDPLRTALRPFDALGALILPASPSEFAVAGGFTTALALALLAGIFASRSRFVPASIARSKRATAIGHAERAEAPAPAAEGIAPVPRRSWARDYQPFALTARGPDAVAFAWLALAAAGPRMAPWRLLMWMGVALGVGLATGLYVPGPVQMLVGGFALQIAFTFAALSGQRMASDLVGQPARLALLKSMPVTGRSIVIGEVLANALVQSSLTVAGWSFAAGVVGEADGFPLPVPGRLAGWAAGVALITSLALLLHATTRALALFLPGWFRTGSLPAQGMAAFGQNLLVLLARVCVVAVASIPAGIVGGAAVLIATAALGWGEAGVSLAILLGGLSAAGVFTATALGAAWVAGEVAYPRCRPAELV